MNRRPSCRRTGAGDPPLVLPLELPRAEALLFSGATAVLALHAAVDAFIAPELGTEAGDHLLRGGATFAVLIVAAYLYARLRAGARAAMRRRSAR